MPEYCVPKIANLPPKGTPRRRVVIVTNHGADTLEYMGPMQVFQEANFFLEHSGRPDLGYDVELASTHPGAVYELKGLKIIVDRPYHRVRGEIDTLMFQAVDGDDRCLQDERFIAWVTRMSKRVRRVASICVGTFILAEAGVLDGRRATTHWCATADFCKRYESVSLDPDPIYIKDGNIYTSAGATAGFDLTVALVEEDFGQELARRVAQGLVMYLKRPGNQAQFSVYLNANIPEESRIHELQSYIADNVGEDLSVEALAERAHMSPRNFARVFASQVGMSPGRFVEQARLERARHFLEQTRAPISQIARRCGYRTANGMRMAFDRQLGVSPRDYRRRFATAE